MNLVNGKWSMSNFLLLFCMFTVLFALDKCCALLTYTRQALLDIGNSHNYLDSTLFLPLELSALPPELTAIVCPGSHHHHSQEGHEAPSPSEPADPRRALRTQRRKRGNRGGLHARLKARASQPPLTSQCAVPGKQTRRIMSQDHNTAGDKRMLCSYFHRDLAFR